MKVLSLAEEEKLKVDELTEYYDQLRAYLMHRKLTNTTPGARFLGPHLKRITNKISFALTKALCGRGAVLTSDGQERIPKGTVLFAHTHQGLLDNFAWIPTNPKHCILFHSTKVKMFLKLIQLNTGLVLVDKEDKASRKNAKLDTIQLLLEGHSVAIWPESAWLLSPNKLHLTMNYGFLDIARKANVPVVPVVSEYYHDTSDDKGRIKKVHISYGTPIYVKPSDSLIEKLEEYDEIISSLRFSIIEQQGVFHRADISNKNYINYLKANLNNLKLGGIDINVERSNLWDYSNDFYRFHYINDVEFDEHDNLLLPSEVRKLEKIRLDCLLKKCRDVL